MTALVVLLVLMAFFGVLSFIRAAVEAHRNTRKEKLAEVIDGPFPLLPHTEQPSNRRKVPEPRQAVRR